MTSGSITSWQIDGEKVEPVTDFIFLGSKTTEDSDCSHEIKRDLLLGRKAMKNLDSLKEQRHHFADKRPYSQSYGFSSSHVWMWELDHKEGWVLKNWCVRIVVLEKILESPLDSLEIKLSSVHFSSVAQSCLTLCDLRESQHARPPCPSPTPGVYPNSCPLSQWCHPAISSSVVPFSSCPQSLPASESFAVNQRFTWGGQSTGVSAPASFPPKKSQGWSPSEWPGWISLQSKVLKSLLQHHSSKASILRHSAFFTVQLSHPYMTTGKTIAFTRWTFVGKVMSLLFNCHLGWS